ncbi:MAG: serine hydrolase [Pseudomonadota bacterium]
MFFGFIAKLLSLVFERRVVRRHIFKVCAKTGVYTLVAVPILFASSLNAARLQYEGKWRATSPEMEITGFVSLDIKKLDNGFQVTLMDPGQEPDVPMYTITAKEVDGKLVGRFRAVFSYFDLNKFLTKNVDMTAQLNADSGALDVNLKDAAGVEVNLEFYSSNDARFLKFDAARLNANGEVVSNYQYVPPVKTKNGFPVSTLKDENISQKRVEEALNAVMKGEVVERPAFVLVAANGKLVLEEYFHGTDREKLWLQYSVTKSITSLLTGIAQDNGEIDVNEPINSYFPDYRSSVWMTSKAGKAGVTPKTLLSMGNVIGWDERAIGENYISYGNMIYHEDGWVDYIFGQPVITHKPGPYLNYNTLMTNVAGMTLERATGKHLSDYVQTELLTPIGETRSYFDSYAAIYGASANEEWPALGGSTVMMRPLAMAKIGQLVLNRGRWQGKQIISADWIEESTSVQALTFEISEFGYGYSWWIRKLLSSGDDDVWCIWARGLGNQNIVIIPAYNLVVAVGAIDFGSSAFLWTPWFEKTLLPALTIGEPFESQKLGAEDLGAVTVK